MNGEDFFVVIKRSRCIGNFKFNTKKKEFLNNGVNYDLNRIGYLMIDESNNLNDIFINTTKKDLSDINDRLFLFRIISRDQNIGKYEFCPYYYDESKDHFDKRMSIQIDLTDEVFKLVLIRSTVFVICVDEKSRLLSKIYKYDTLSNIWENGFSMTERKIIKDVLNIDDELVIIMEGMSTPTRLRWI